MTIYKSKTHVDVYRAKARASDINELSGRSGRPDLTRFVIDEMIARVGTKPGMVFVDVGCGDGSSLKRLAQLGFDGYQERLIGILPTREEVDRVRANLLDSPETSHLPVSIQQGLADETRLPSGYADVMVCNGVFLVLGSQENIEAALREFHRVAKPGAAVFIGEVPDSDELADRRYGDSITGWLVWVWRNQGAVQFMVRARQALRGLIGSEPFVVGPKTIFHLAPAQFIALMQSHGFTVIEHYRHRELDSDGTVRESATRWNFLARKEA